MSSFFDFCASARKVRNTIQPITTDITLMRLKEQVKAMQLDAESTSAALKEKSEVATTLQTAKEDLEKSLSTCQDDLALAQSKLAALTLEHELKMNQWAAERQDLEEKLSETEKEHQLHMDICQHEKQEAHVLQLQTLQDTVDAVKRDTSVERQLLKLQVAKYAAELVEVGEELRDMKAKYGKK